MDDDFPAAFDWLLQDEGTDYVDDPDDHGGPTRYGITQRSWSGYIGRAATAAEIAALTLEEAHAFYRALYWEPLQMHRIRDRRIKVALFDIAVVAGIPRAVKLLQAALPSLKEDGILGPVTRDRINAIPAPGVLMVYAREVSLFFLRLVEADPAQMKFARGWLSRCWRLASLAI